MTERLDRIEQQQTANTEAIAQLNATLNVIADEFIRPIAQQSQANFQAIGQIDGDLYRLNASHAASIERLDHIESVLAITAVQQAQNTEGIDTLLGAVSTTEIEMQRVFTEIAESNKRFENLRNEAIADRQEFRTQAEADRAEFRQQGEAFREALEADRLSFREALASDRAEWQTSFNAQQEIIQRLLLEIRSTNGEVNQLGDRVDSLEQAS
jgi:DNA repair exonuclease SbcCD ATPase subunit